MTAALHQFPTPPDHAARIAAREQAVTLARQIIRAPLHYNNDSVRLACKTLDEYGDYIDRMQAEQVLLGTFCAPKPKPVARPPYSPPVMRIRDVLAGGIAVAVVGWAVLVGVMVW